MHPLIVTPLFPPAVGGAATHFGKIVPGLAERDEIEQVTVLTEQMPGQPRELSEGKVCVLRYLPTRVSLPQQPWLIHAIIYVLTQARFAACLPGLVRRCGASLIHFHTRYRGRLFYSALRRSRVSVIADLHDKLSDASRLVGVADWLLCCSEGVRRFALEGGFPAERTALVPIPFEPPVAPSPAAIAEVRKRCGLSGRRYLLFVGDITPNKGIYDLLDAYERWRVRHPDVDLVLAGPNREGERFMSRVEGREGATYLGRLPHGDVLALMREAEIVVLPSRSEGLPRVILEAVALGRKVICPPKVPEFEQHLPSCVLPRVDADCIGEMLDRVWGDVARHSYPFHEYESGRVVARLVEAYAEAVGGEK